MGLRTILKDKDPTLKKKSRSVTDFNKRLWDLLDDMYETMMDANGSGLAAPQVGILKRAALVAAPAVKENSESAEPSQDDDCDEVIIELINPEILEISGEQTGLEGCLSLPGVWGIVTRPMRVKVRAQDRYGDYFEAEGEGLMARAICHEVAHLDGELFTEVADKILDNNELEALIADREEKKDAEKSE